ncbi:response regulator [Micavibrio aeruginosavorus]|uniref:Response regulator n=1 Tax=Micavibrio aeruginosavorus (strain ARL-13) TaxID=856793 RepID=G2KMR3_MICAA|nr:response regulator [Micavibrio aeruginosavorus]AEP08450.1 response regulator [Micavibrio aeruginosavorus ARL-13]
MAFRFDKLSVLIAEDTVPMQKLMASVLESLGVGYIYTASDGNRAFEQFQRFNTDIVIADWHMTPASGIDLTREIRTSTLSPNRMAPIILVTGYSALARVAEARDAGVTEFLVKPFSANDIAKRIAHVINKPRDFIDCTGYFGPDRRRRVMPDFKGPYRRFGESQQNASKSA